MQTAPSDGPRPKCPPAAERRQRRRRPAEARLFHRTTRAVAHGSWRGARPARCRWQDAGSGWGGGQLRGVVMSVRPALPQCGQCLSKRGLRPRGRSRPRRRPRLAS
eukprot:354908-Chlamydomonas_euryale.AAC.4